MFCQQLLSVVKLGGVCVPFKHKVKACTCSETYICIGYVLPTIVDVHLYWIYSANNCRVLFSWGLSVCHSGTRLGHLHVLRYIFVLDMFCQQLWGVVRLGGVHLYWIYSANGFLCALRAQGWENVPFWNMYQLNIYVGIGCIMPTLGGWIKVDNKYYKIHCGQTLRLWGQTLRTDIEDRHWGQTLRTDISHNILYILFLSYLKIQMHKYRTTIV